VNGDEQAEMVDLRPRGAGPCGCRGVRYGSPHLADRAVSPDGTWSVEVYGQPMMTGSYEVFIVIRNENGQKVSGFAEDSASGWDVVKSKYAVTFLDAERVRLVDRALKKSDYIHE
jgi:hypothetical protein